MPYYPYFAYVQAPDKMGAEHYRLLEQAVTVPSSATHAIGEACQQAGMVVSIGVNERDHGTLYNAHYCSMLTALCFRSVARSLRPTTSA